MLMKLTAPLTITYFVTLMANINDGTNRLIINDTVIPSSDWVGTGVYTYTNGTRSITIDKIAEDTGNIMIEEITGSHYKLVATKSDSVIYASDVIYGDTNVADALDGKQDELTFDATPTSASNNPVTSGGLYNAFRNANSTLKDSTPTSGSNKPITSGGVDTALTNLLKTVYPVGAIYMSTSSTSPATLFGFGTWARITGKFLLGVTDDATNTGYSQATTKTGGVTSGTRTLGSTHIPYHRHTVGNHKHTVTGATYSAAAGSAGGHVHKENFRKADATGELNDAGLVVGGPYGGRPMVAVTTSANYGNMSTGGAHSHDVTLPDITTTNQTATTYTGYYGGDTDHNTASFDIRPPFYAVYIWRRTA